MGFIRVQVQGMEGVRGSLERVRRLRGARKGLAAAAVHIKSQFATYPPRRTVTRKSVYGRSFASDAQRRFIFAAIRRGDIPYTRGINRTSEALGRRWTVEARRGGLEQVVGNNASYAEYVQGDRQSKLMAAMGWERVDVIVKREARTVQRIVDYYVEREDL